MPAKDRKAPEGTLTSTLINTIYQKIRQISTIKKSLEPNERGKINLSLSLTLSLTPSLPVTLRLFKLVPLQTSELPPVGCRFSLAFKLQEHKLFQTKTKCEQ